MENPATLPTGSLEHRLLHLWNQVLDVVVGPNDNFFEVGGNSIKAVRIMNRLQDEMNAIFHPASVFDAPTVAELAEYLRKNYPNLFRDEQTTPACGHKLSDEQIEVARNHLLHRNSGGLSQVAASDEKNPPAIFILSPPRSGSTLLRVILGGHSALFCPPELYLLSFNTLKQRRNRFSGHLDYFREGLVQAIMELNHCPCHEAEALLNSHEKQATSTKAFFGLMQDWAGERRIVDKTPSYAFNPHVLHRAETEFDRALFIHLVRHPMASVSSFEEIRADLVTGNAAQELPFSPRQKGELWWLIGQENILSFLKGIPDDRQYRIKYEDMVASPEMTIRRLCSFLDIGFHPEMLNPYQEKKQRMTDGVTPVSKILGDQKFHTFKTIDASVADRWRDKYQEDFLCEKSWVMAASLGYSREPLANAEREEWEI